MNIKFQPFHCSGFVQTDISNSDLDSLGDIIKSADKTKQSYLAGVQTDNWMIPDAKQVLEPYISNLVIAYSQTYVELTDEYEREIGKVISPKYKIDSLNLDEIWVNITEKYMYNPPHNHQGIYSYVVFYKIPFSLEEERKLPHVKKSNQPYPGCFYFIHPAHSGHTYIQNVEVDRGAEGTMILFPARVFHGVHPYYTSDETRITIAGNVTL
jgi:hypothetical protein